MEQLKLHQKLIEIQRELKAPKNQHNNFGNYNYRSCEDILEAVKPLAHKYGCYIAVIDDVIPFLSNHAPTVFEYEVTEYDKYKKEEVTKTVREVISYDRFYVKATATISDGEATISTTACARESLDKKGMDDSQITGSTSSYARKYALNGLFAIDDTKDADTKDNTAKGATNTPKNNANEGQNVKQNDEKVESAEPAWRSAKPSDNQLRSAVNKRTREGHFITRESISNWTAGDASDYIGNIKQFEEIAKKA